MKSKITNILLFIAIVLLSYSCTAHVHQIQKTRLIAKDPVIRKHQKAPKKLKKNKQNRYCSFKENPIHEVD